MMRILTAHNIIKGFWVFSCADIYFSKNQSPKAFNFVQNGNFSLSAIFCYHRNGKIEINAEILHFSYSSNS